jgi:hypothetical protein
MIQGRPAHSEAQAHISDERLAQLLCAMAHALFRIEDRLDDLTTLAQQRNDLIREERVSNESND